MERFLDHSVNVIAYEKNGKKYGMACAWAMMCDYDKIMCLLGSGSVTGANISKGDFIGISCLKNDQKEIALKMGDGHSDKVDKLEGIDYTVKNGAILINNSMTMNVCEVLDVMHVHGMEADYLVYVKVVDSKSTEGKFLHMEDF